MKYTLQFEHISSVELQKLIEFLTLHKYDFSPLPNDGKPLVMRSLPDNKGCPECGASWNSAHQHNKGCSLAGNDA